MSKHEHPTRQGAAVGLGWGLSAGVVAALFPPVGIGLVGPTAGGTALGALLGQWRDQTTSHSREQGSFTEVVADATRRTVKGCTSDLL
ncbi:hypothetical protein [Rhodococcus pyridinivorans]